MTVPAMIDLRNLEPLAADVLHSCPLPEHRSVVDQSVEVADRDFVGCRYLLGGTPAMTSERVPLTNSIMSGRVLLGAITVVALSASADDTCPMPDATRTFTALDDGDGSSCFVAGFRAVYLVSLSGVDAASRVSVRQSIEADLGRQLTR